MSNQFEYRNMKLLTMHEVDFAGYICTDDREMVALTREVRAQAAEVERLTAKWDECYIELALLKSSEPVTRAQELHVALGWAEMEARSLKEQVAQLTRERDSAQNIARDLARELASTRRMVEQNAKDIESLLSGPRGEPTATELAAAAPVYTHKEHNFSYRVDANGKRID